MAADRAVFWTCVALLLGTGFLVGQVAAVMVAAMAAIVIAFLNDRMNVR